MAHKNAMVFAGRPVPKDSERWSAFNQEGTRCMWKDDDGVEIGDFPLAELSPDTLRARWGTGYYRIQFVGTRAGKPKALGHREIIVNDRGAPVTASASAPAPAPAPLPASDLSHAFAIVDAIDRRAAIAAERDRAFVQLCLATAVGQRSSEPSAELVALRQEVAQLRSALVVVDDDEDDDDDEDETPRTAANDKPFKVGKNIGDAALVAGLNGLAETLGALTPGIQALVMARLQAEVQKAAQTQPAPANGAPNAGATTG